MSLLQFTPIIRLLRDMCCYNLELQLERQLDRAGTADLIQRIQAAALAAAAQITVQGLRRNAELRRGHVVDRRAELRVVEDVEKIGAGLQRKTLAELEQPLQGEIDLRSVEAAQGVASQVALAAGGQGKGRVIDDPSAGRRWVGEVQGRAGLRLIAVGNANKQIADQLSITEETVKSRVKSILSKLGANDRTHAAMIGVKRGIIEL